MIEAPLSLYRDTVKPEWVDYNGHLSEAYYVLVFGFTTDALLDYLGLDANYRQRTHYSAYTVEAHLNYLRELQEGVGLRLTTQLLGFDAKRLHVFHRMYHAERDDLAATTELMLLHVDQGQGRAAPLPAMTIARLEEIQARHAALPRPAQAGRSISL